MSRLKNDDYFWYLVSIIDPKHVLADKFLPVLEELYFIDFRWSKRYEDDENRAKDGLELRNIYMMEHGNIENTKAKGGKSCSCLEVLIGLARRIEYEIVGLPGEENVPKWFWMFIDSMGFVRDLAVDFHEGFSRDFNGSIESLEPGMWDRNYIRGKINTWLDRAYRRDGRGGIFIIDYPHFDPTRRTIWAQMNAFLYLNGDGV